MVTTLIGRLELYVAIGGGTTEPYSKFRGWDMKSEVDVVDYSSSEGTEEVIMPSRRCPHCRVVSSYSQGVEKQPFGSGKRGRFDTCTNAECGCSVLVVYGGSGEELAVYPQLETEPDEVLPDDVRVAFRQALQSLNEKIWDGCVLMCRRALEEATTNLGAKGKVLYEKIEDLAKKNRITPDLRQWAHEGRLAGKLGAHGTEEEDKKWNEQADAEEIVEFSKWFFRYVYVLPEQLKQRRKRLTGEAEVTEEASAEKA
jgi:hypothetical protein